MLPLLLSIALAQSDPQAQLSGHVWRIDEGQPLADARVRLWAPDDKSWNIVESTTTDADGAYTFEAAAGQYKIDARGPEGGSNWIDRWYEAGGNGLVDSDLLEVGWEDVLTDLDMVMSLGGGLDGRVTAGGSARAGVMVRLQRLSEPRYHHNDQTQVAPHLGRFYMRGLFPVPDDYAALAYDPLGQWALAIEEGPFTVPDGGNGALPDDIVLEPPAPDPYEPNDGPDEAEAASVAALPFASAGSRIGPRSSGDVDWFCWVADPFDRYLLWTDSRIVVAGEPQQHPWLDPVLAFWDASGPTPVRIAQDDDSGPGLDALLDAGEVVAGGTVCATVTTYGDVDWIGEEQGSVGAYQVGIEMGNRRPSIAAEHQGSPVTGPVAAAEGEAVLLVLQVSDPEGDLLTLTSAFEDSAGVDPGTWTWDDQDPSLVFFSWIPDDTAAQGTPYTLTVTASDAEFTTTAAVLVQVDPVNVPPSTPVLIAPDDGGAVGQAFPVVTWAAATDIDGDPLSYEVQWTVGTSPPVVTTATGTTAEGPFVADGTWVAWRVRAFDGLDHGGWSQVRIFLVETENTPPEVPTLDKPPLGEQVLVRRPALSALTIEDPEGDAISIEFQVASDVGFDPLVDESAPVAQATWASNTAWTVDQALPWGEVVYWRARALDDRGATSDWSEPSWFRLKANLAPSAPGFGGVFQATCEGRVVEASPDDVVLTPATDPEGEDLSLEVAVEPEGGAPMLQTTLPQADGDATEIPLGAELEENGHYIFRARADDGTDVSEWATCDLWLDAVDGVGDPIAILAPHEEEVLPIGTFDVDVRVASPTDPDAAVPASDLVVAWCVRLVDEGCPEDVRDWSATAIQGEETTFALAGLEAEHHYRLTVCARTERGVCASEDDVRFAVTEGRGGVGAFAGCGCATGPAGGSGLAAILALLTGWVRRRPRPAPAR